MDLGTELLLLRLTIAPLFIGLVSLVALRYGHETAGWMVALPINTGTILFILTLSDGTAFAASAAVGALLGIVSLSVFVVGYARSASHFSWPICLGIATLGYVASTFLLSVVPGSIALGLAAAVLSVVIVVLLVPRPSRPVEPAPLPRWEIPVRMVTAAILVAAVTTAADALGARLSGLLSPIPVFTITLVIFTHSRQGPDPVFAFLSGLEYGLFSFAAFCAVAAAMLVPFGYLASLLVGLLAFLAVYLVVRVSQRHFRAPAPKPGGSSP